MITAPKANSESVLGIGQGGTVDIGGAVPTDITFWLSVTPVSEVDPRTSHKLSVSLNYPLEVMRHEPSVNQKKLGELGDLPSNVHLFALKPR